MNWRELALCRQFDPDLWFPEAGEGDNGHIAKQVCRQCPVRLECLTDAIDRHEREGIFGGFSRNKRAKITDPLEAIVEDENTWWRKEQWRLSKQRGRNKDAA